MASLVRTLAALALCTVCLAWVVLPNSSRVVRPRLGVPAILAPGESFALEVESSVPFVAPSVRARLERPGAEVLELDLHTTSARGARHTFEVQLPDGLPEGAWTLVVRTGERIERLPKAVHVRREWPDELCLVQLADLPEFWPDGSGARAMGQLASEINLIAPDLVLLSGDLAYGGSVDRYEGLMASLELFDAPVICVIGNHEYQGLSGFMTHLRVPQHVIDAGPLRVISLNSSHGRDQFTLSALNWLERSLAGSGERTPLVQAHHPPFGRRSIGTRQSEFIELCESFDVPIVLFGHLHADRAYEASGADRGGDTEFTSTIFAVATAAGAMLHPEVSTGGDYHGFRVVRLARSNAGEPYRLVSFTYDLDGDGMRDASASFPMGKLTVATLEAGSVRVTNDSNEAIPRAHVWIDLPAGVESASTDVGRVLGTRERADGRQLGVQLDLPAGASVDVRVLPVSLRRVLERVALLQFPLLFLPGLIVTLAIYGSEFELTSGRVIAGLLIWLPIQGLVTRPLARRVAASTLAWTLVCAAVALVVSWAYRPLHFAWWDERSVEHALRLVAIGVPSLFLSGCAAARVRASGEAVSRGLPAGLVLCALPWLASVQHPNFVFFGVALAAAASLAAGAALPGLTSGSTPSSPALPPGVLLWSIALATIDLSLPVWERNLEGGFGGAVALALVAAGVGAAIPRARGVFLAQAVPTFLAACVMPAWALNPAHQVFAGLALGAALGDLGSSGRRGLLAAATFCIGAAWLAANGLTQNLAFAPARAVLVLIPIWLWWRARQAAKL